MPSQRTHDRIHRVRLYLREHTAVRFFALPIVLMGAILLFFFLASGRATPLESVSMVGLFVVASLVVVSVSVLVERTVLSLRSS
ncbi:hypothetical protein [Halomarina oriensis]|uniref:Uncharacterized protein n=1 Tax=Halomarina oriensis TaxID=671145 RepID=A0A6B0GRQ4_9EURY|nr:hypothetical protein [Halomarina oriensis]MWG36821.1 hypothetical protein [Halomarina oriensis]